MNGRAIPGAYLFRLYVCDKEMSWHHRGKTHQPDWVVYVRDSEKFRLTNVIPERIIFLSRGITVLHFHLSLGLPSGPFLSCFPIKPWTLFIFPIRTTCFAHLIHHLITLIMCGEEHTSRSTLLHCFVRNSVVGTSTGYGLGGSRIVSPWRTGFCAPVQPSSGAHPAPYTIGTGSFPGVKRPGCGVKHPTPSSAEVKEREKLYFCPPSGSSWHVVGWTLTFYVLVLSPSFAQTSSPAPHSRRPSTYLLPLIRQTKIHTHTKQQQKSGGFFVMSLNPPLHWILKIFFGARSDNSMITTADLHTEPR